tara:strand:- start:505 stop:750 length:246 start_codon:yes stop_codon:yes gene_type:complete
MKEYKRKMIDYMLNRALADQAKALASLDLLLDHGAGIGDHSTGDYWSNVDASLDLLVDADDRLEAIERYFTKEIDVDNLPY